MFLPCPTPPSPPGFHSAPLYSWSTQSGWTITFILFVLAKLMALKSVSPVWISVLNPRTHIHCILDTSVHINSLATLLTSSADEHCLSRFGGSASWISTNLFSPIVYFLLLLQYCLVSTSSTPVKVLTLTMEFALLEQKDDLSYSFNKNR